jgi:NAD-dependent SIR2 family protein deacetylase
MLAKRTQPRKFYCKKCDETFWKNAAVNVAEEALFIECPQCRTYVGLYQALLPVLNKRVEDWGLAEWVIVIGSGVIAYHGIKTLASA